MNLEDKLNEYRKRVDQIQEETAEEKDTCLNRVLSYLDHVHETDLNYSGTDLRILRFHPFKPI